MDNNPFKTLSSSSFLLSSSPIYREEIKQIQDIPKNVEILISETNSKILNKQCETHKTRMYEQICLHPDCMRKKMLFCSKCILENENHNIGHRNHLCDIEVYIIYELYFNKLFP